MKRPSIPVTILSGFLGAGKSTLLNEFLGTPGGKATAIVVNEFGDVAIDHDLVRSGQPKVQVTTTGCLCCTATSGIRVSLFELHEAERQRPGKSFSRVIVETTGLSDPAPTVNELIPGGAGALGYRDHLVAKRFHLAGFVCVLDVLTAGRSLQNHFECLKQLAFADRIVLTKTDLAKDASTQADLTHLLDQVRAVNPSAEIIDCHEPAFDIDALFRPRLYTIARRGPDVEAWLALEQVLAAEQPPNPHAASSRHGSRIRTFSLVEDKPIAPEDFAEFLALLRAVAGERLLRLKGIVALADNPAKPVVAHAVQHVIHPPLQLETWPSDDRRTRLVLITDNLDQELVRKLFDAITGPKPSRIGVRVALAVAGLIAIAALVGASSHSLAWRHVPGSLSPSPLSQRVVTP